ncbi:ABC transporter permease [Spirochaeta lutea]|uniref:ABC transporter permease n=1 Tax=Spirochaeta lutea TaxID=1480694 RepID=UPI00068AE1CF|nr:FtsX-like permease family protein [Spirochaeta lutea]
MKTSAKQPNTHKTPLGFIFTLSWKNLSRHKKRTIITASAIAFGLSMYLFLDAWLLGAELDSERNLIWYETSSARVHNPEYWENRERLELKHVISQPARVIQEIEELGYPAAPRTVFRADLAVRQDPFPTDGSMQVRVYAIDPQRDDQVFRLSRTIEEGGPLSGPGLEGLAQDGSPGETGTEGLSDELPGALIGRWLAEDLGAEVGYPITLITRTREGFYQTIDLEIQGILNSPNPMINRGTVFISLGTADRALQMQGAVTEVNIRMPDRADTYSAAAQLEEDLSGVNGGLGVYPWQEIARDYIAMSSTKRQGSGLMLFLVFIIAAVGISNTMLMVVFERTRELGTLRAIGMKDGDIRLNFLFEAGGIGILGGLGGLVMGSLLVAFVTYIGVDFSFMLRDIDIGYRLSGVMYGAWHPAAMIGGFALCVIMTMVVAYFPTRRALDMEITDCLRDE